jgi:hypothetical protein
VSVGGPLDFYLQGSRGSYACAAAAVDGWQCLSISCTGCGSRYFASVARRDQSDDAATVAGYPDVTGQMLLAARNLAAECPDHGYRLRVRAFTVVA